MKPTFSILIPIIKSAFLAQSIESVLKQTSLDWELVLYNDASPDDINTIIEKYKDPRIQYYVGEKNLGKEDPSKTWNKMLSFTQGQYVCLLGDDDYISENYLEEIQKLISLYPHVDIFRTTLKRVDEKNTVILSDDPLPEHESWEESLYQRNVKNRQQSTSEFVLKKSTLLDIGGYVSFPLAWGTDDVTYLLMAKKHGIASTNKAYAYWRKSAWNISDNDGQRISEQDRTLFLLRERDFIDTMFPSHIPAHTLYKSIDVKLMETEVRKYWHERMEIETELQNVRGREEKTQVHIQKLELELHSAKQETVTLDAQLRTEIEQLQNTLGVVQEIKSHLQIQTELLQKNLHDKENHIAVLHQRIGRYEEQIHILNQHLNENEKIIEQGQIYNQKLQEDLVIQREQKKEIDVVLENSQKTVQELTLRTESLQNGWNTANQKATELDARIQHVTSELEETKKTIFSKNQELERIYFSREWKAALILRRIVKFFIPIGSMRRRFAVFLWRIIKTPIRYVLDVRKKRHIASTPHEIDVRSSESAKQKYLEVKPKAVFVGHSYHSKTKSSTFFIEYLSQFYDIEVALDESWQGKPFLDLSFIDHTHTTVIFWQNIPPADILQNIQNTNIVFFPMYDAVAGFGYEFWKNYKHIKIVNFSKTLHEKLRTWKLDSLYVQYFPKPEAFTPGNAKEVFFWQRITKININTIVHFFKKEHVKIHIHTAIDPYQEFVKPERKDEEKFNITYSEWFEKKDDIHNLITQKGIYIAPREFEGIGMSFLEAMAMGKAVIAANNPTMNEYIEHGKTGYLFDVAHPIKIDLSDIKQVQKNAYHFIEEGYKQWILQRHKIINFIDGYTREESQPLITIVTVTFNLVKANRENFFRQCVESVHNQTYKNIEHIVIDGASTDGTVTILKEYAEKGWIRYLSESDTGIYDAMNKGIKLAKGKYIAFLNSDDYYHNDLGVELSINALERSGADFSYAPVEMISDDGTGLDFDHQHRYPDISRVFFTMPFCHQTMFVKREVLLKEGMFDMSFKIAGDYDLLIRLCLKQYTSVFVACTFVTFRYSGLSFVNGDQAFTEVVQSYFTHYNTLVPISKEACMSIQGNRGDASGIPLALAQKLSKLEPYFDYDAYLHNDQIYKKIRELKEFKKRTSTFLNYGNELRKSYLSFICPGDTVIDIGSYDGVHLGIFSNVVGENGFVFGFESLPEQYAFLEKSLESRKNITIIDKALSNTIGTSDFFRINERPEESGFKKRIQESGNALLGSQKIQVSVDILDTYIDTFSKIDFIRISTQGSELLVLEGAKKTLEKFRPIMAIGYGYHAYSLYGYENLSLFLFAQKNKYALFDLWGNLIPDIRVWRDVCDSVYWDFFLVPEEKVESFVENMTNNRRDT